MKKKVGYYGVFLALALVLSYVESLIPFYFGVPGMKLGLTNVIVLILLYLYGPADADHLGNAGYSGGISLR